MKNGISPNTNVTSFSESSVSLIEQIARDSHPIRRQDYLKCLFQNGINLLRDSCGSKAIFTLIALHKGRADADIRQILEQDQIDIEKPNTASGRSILDWADNGFFCDSQSRDTIYAYYQKKNPETAFQRKQETQSLFLSQQESRQAQELNAFSKAEQDFLKNLHEQNERPPEQQSPPPRQESSHESPLNDEFLKQGVQIIHLAGAVLSALGNHAQKIDTQDITQLSPQKIKDFIKTFVR